MEPSCGTPAPGRTDSPDGVEVSVVMPCLNEHETVGTCVEKAIGALAQAAISGEVIVADNGSTDGSQQIAASLYEEWVYNEADLDNTRVLFAHDLGDVRNAELSAAYPGRSAWRLGVSTQQVTLEPYLPLPPFH